MKVCAQLLAFNIDKWIPALAENLVGRYERIFIALPKRPWGYNHVRREEQSNSTTRLSLESQLGHLPIEIVEGDWDTEESTRNDLLHRARVLSFDWMIVNDADEFYENDSWAQALDQLATATGDAYRGTWTNFWKTPEFFLVNRAGIATDTNACFAIRCRSDVQFKRARATTRTEALAIDANCQHYGYVMSDKELLDKIETWAHSNDFDRRTWYKLKWLGWTLKTKYLHPTHPSVWYQAREWTQQQPEFARFFANKQGSCYEPITSQLIENLRYDIKVRCIETARRIRSSELFSR